MLAGEVTKTHMMTALEGLEISKRWWLFVVDASGIVIARLQMVINASLFILR